MKASSNEPASRGKTILLAEDHEIIREMVRDMLTRKGYCVIAHRDGREAFASFQESGNGVDLIVADVVMPGLNGTDLARKCREQRPDIAVLYMSSRIEGRFNAEEDLVGNADFIAKPFSSVELLRKVKDLVEPRAPEG